MLPPLDGSPVNQPEAVTPRSWVGPRLSAGVRFDGTGAFPASGATLTIAASKKLAFIPVQALKDGLNK